MFEQYYRSMSQEDRAAYAERAGTSKEYIEIHLIPRRKVPKKQTMRALSDASEGAVTFEDVVSYFFFNDVA